MQNADIYNLKRLYKDAKCRHINKLVAMLAKPTHKENETKDILKT
jgi:hypothetical protein